MKATLTEETTKVVTPVMVTITMTEEEAHKLEWDLEAVLGNHKGSKVWLRKLYKVIMNEIGQR